MTTKVTGPCIFLNLLPHNVSGSYVSGLKSSHGLHVVITDDSKLKIELCDGLLLNDFRIKYVCQLAKKMLDGTQTRIATWIVS
jgi:hypothetical protein